MKHDYFKHLRVIFYWANIMVMNFANGVHT